MKILSLRNRYRASSVFALSLAFLLLAGSSAYAALTLSATSITSSTGDLDLSSNRIVIDNPGPTFTGSSSRQTVQADANFSSFSGFYGAGVMGNALGTVGAGANSIVAGLIGKYNVATNNSDHPAAGVVGEVGEDSAGTADAAVMAVLGGDSGAVTAGAAYAVRNLNSTNGNGFSYGLDLFSGAIDSYMALSYGTADIRLQNGETINNSPDGVVAISGGIKIPKDAASATNATNATSPTGITCGSTTLGTLTWVDDTDTAGGWLWLCEQTGGASYAWEKVGP